jgi:hypothetical protein
MNVKVNVHASQQPDGSVRCKVECDGQEATLLFTGTEVVVGVPDLPAADRQS